METQSKTVSFRSNVYLKLVAKTFKPDDKSVEHKLKEEIEKKYGELAAKGEATKELTDVEINELRNKVIEDNTFYSHQLVKIKPSKLLDFINQNSPIITRLEMPLLTRYDIFDEIVADYKLPKDLTKLPIYIDSQTTLINIFRVTKESLEKLKEDGEISKEAFDMYLSKFNFT